ncbi:MAG TPA: hypothetical protein V6C72_11800 [Chroococcales cyanobacterium]
MDLRLKKFLDDQDWEDLTFRLTLQAKRFLVRYSFLGRSSAETQERCVDYALETAAKAYDACVKERPGRFDLDRGNQDRVIEKRFFTYLTWNILRRLITDDITQAKLRSPMVLLALEEAEGVVAPAEPISVEQDDEAELILLELMEDCGPDLQKLITGCVKQLNKNPDKTRINWTQLETDLGITRYKRDQLRHQLETELGKLIAQRCQPSTP